MSNLMLLLSLVCLICLPIGLVKPTAVIRWGDVEKRTRKKVLKYYGIGFIVTFILFGITLPKNANTDSKSTTAQSDSSVKEKTEEQKAADDAKKKADDEAKAKAAAEAQKAKEEADAKAAAEKAAKEQEEKIGYDTGITYDQLARTPDDYKGKKAKFNGKVVQVIEGDGETDLRIAVDGNYDKILFVAYKSNITSTRILENDHVTVSGKSSGIYKYKSTMGGQISVPSMLVEKIELNQ